MEGKAHAAAGGGDDACLLYMLTQKHRHGFEIFSFMARCKRTPEKEMLTTWAKSLYQ